MKAKALTNKNKCIRRALWCRRQSRECMSATRARQVLRLRCVLRSYKERSWPRHCVLSQVHLAWTATARARSSFAFVFQDLIRSPLTLNHHRVSSINKSEENFLLFPLSFFFSNPLRPIDSTHALTPSAWRRSPLRHLPSFLPLLSSLLFLSSLFSASLHLSSRSLRDEGRRADADGFSLSLSSFFYFF